GSLSIISSVFSKEEKGKAIGTWSASTTIVTICGPVLGGALADIGLWRFIFFMNIPLGVVAYVVLQFKVPESREPGASRVDWIGATILVLSLAFLTFGFLQVPEWGYGHPYVVISLALGLLLLVTFVFTEKKVSEPMVPLSLFNNAMFSGVNLLSFFLYAGLGGLMLFMSLNVIQIQGYSQFQAGLTFLPFSFMMIIIARKMGGMTDKYGARRFLIMGPLITGVGMVWLSMIGITEGPSEYWTTFFPPFMIFAFGMSITVVPLTTAVMSSVSENLSGVASGINNSVTRISGTFMNAILGAVALLLFTNHVLDDISDVTLTGEMKEQIIIEASNLGESRAPATYSSEDQKMINAIYGNSFIATYRWVGLLSAALAFISSGIAFFMIKERIKHD
ncbi:MAG: MFS transporter, partial [Bacteroidota bacterium]